jgi:hypothetical protein
MSGLIELLALTRSAGLHLSRGEDDTLRVRGPRAEALARQLL